MMKKLLIFFAITAFAANLANAQYAEVATPSEITPIDSPESTNALFDILFITDLESEIGANGNAGVVYFNGEFWVSAWASDVIHVLDPNGSYIESFTIPGLSGSRSFTTDGTSIFAGTAANQIYEIDPVNRTLVGTINISPSTDATARMVTYDETLDGGNGGFWTGNFTSDIASFNMTGTQLSVIPQGTHGIAGIYGGAVDNLSAGGPFLWVHAQGAAGMSDVIQLQLPAGTPTGVVFDAHTISQPAAIAGGLFISEDVVADKVTIVGVAQGTPDILFGIELIDNTAGVNDNSVSNFNLYPNPANGKVNIQTTVAGEKQVVVYDILGKQVINTVVSGSELNISALKAGVYMVSVTQNKATATKKLIVQ